MISRLGWVVVAMVLGLPAWADEAGPQTIFEKRIMPIFNSPNPSSCVQCHLAGVDLKNYILPSSEKTFLSLRDQALIDLDAPEKSKILKLIDMGSQDRRSVALIHEKTRTAEREAFAAWIRACCDDPKLRAAPRLDAKEVARPALPDAVIRHGRKDRLLESFERNIWAMRFRCMSCHIEGTPENDQRRKEFGDRVAWIKKAGPEATMEYLISSKLINLKKPEESLLLLKPLGEESHKGGIKFLPGDLGYKAFRTWIEDVAAVRSGKYTTTADLPALRAEPRRFGTDIWFKLNATPPEWGDKLLMVQIFAWDVERKAWETEPIATSDRGVWGKGKLWQHNLTLQAPTGSSRAATWKNNSPTLPPGRFLVKVFVDRDGRMGKDWNATWSDSDFVGQAIFDARWREGYNAMTEVDARQVHPVSR